MGGSILAGEEGTQVYGPQSAGSAFLMRTAGVAEKMAVLYEKLDQLRLGRWDVLYKLEQLFAPALPPGTCLPLPNHPAPRGLQIDISLIWLQALYLQPNCSWLEEKQVQKSGSVCLRVAEQLGWLNHAKLEINRHCPGDGLISHKWRK